MKAFRRTKLTPKYEGGGLFFKDSASGGGLTTGANIGIGAATGALGLIPSGVKANESLLEDQDYASALNKRDKAFAGVQEVGSTLMKIPDPTGMTKIAGGVIMLGGKAADLLGVGKGKVEKAAQQAQQRKTDKEITGNLMAGAQNRASYPGYVSPAYGANGMKFKTKTMDNMKSTTEKTPLSIKGDVEDILKLAYGGKVDSLADGGVAQGPTHEQGGIPVQQEGMGEQPVAEIEGGERVFSVEDTQAMEEMAAQIIQAMEAGDQQSAEQMAAELGMAVVQMIAQQEQNMEQQDPNQAAMQQQAMEAETMNSFQNG